MNLKNIKKLTFEGVELKSLSVNGVLAWKSGYKNWVRYSTEADGKTIYNGGLGYKEGCRVRSGGAEATTTDTACTGFIPYKQGDILLLYPKWAGQNTINAINFADAEFNNIGQFTGTALYGICLDTAYRTQWNAIMTGLKTQTGNITTLDISSVGNAGDIAYVRITVPWKRSDAASVMSGSDIIITVNEELVL